MGAGKLVGQGLDYLFKAGVKGVKKSYAKNVAARAKTVSQKIKDKKLDVDDAAKEISAAKRRARNTGAGVGALSTLAVPKAYKYVTENYEIKKKTPVSNTQKTSANKKKVAANATKVAANAKRVAANAAKVTANTKKVLANKAQAKKK